MRKITRSRRSFRGFLPLVLVLALLWPAEVAHAAPSCSFDDTTGTVSVTAVHAEVPTISRLGDAIALDGVACGTATVTNTGTIDLPFPDDFEPDTVVIDLTGGPLAPGATDEGDGSSEIEIEVTRGDGSFDTLRIVGSSGHDAFTVIPLLSVNLNAGETVPDADVTADDTISLELVGADGDDDLSVDVLGSFARTTVLAGDGDDRLAGRGLGSDDDILDAGPGHDFADFSSMHEEHVIWQESGGLEVGSSGGVVENVEVAILTDGGDSVRYEGNAIGETFLGHNADTVEVSEPASTASAEGRIVHGGSGAFDQIRFDTDSSVFVDLWPGRLEGTFPMTHDGFEFIIGDFGDDQFLAHQRGTYPKIFARLGEDTLDLRWDAHEGMKVTLGQNPIGDGRWLRAFDIENVYGTPFDDVFLGPKSGADGAVALWGFLGTDFLRGGDEADLLQGDKGADTLLGRDGADTLFGSRGDDRLRGGRSLDELRGGPGDDVLIGGPGVDACVGGLGSDRIDCER